jgi:hypothetical protein
VFAPGRSTYVHSQTTERLLVDSGWHCSFCFRTLVEFQAKMTGASAIARRRSFACGLDRGLTPATDGRQATHMPTGSARPLGSCSTRSASSASSAPAKTSSACGARPTACVLPFHFHLAAGPALITPSSLRLLHRAVEGLCRPLLARPLALGRRSPAQADRGRPRAFWLPPPGWLQARAWTGAVASRLEERRVRRGREGESM